MEMGVGIHGEPGRRRVPLAPADAIAGELVHAILKDLSPRQGTPVLLLVNGFGGTPTLELYLMANAARRVLGDAGLTVARSLTGSYVTSLEMAGCSLTLTALDEPLLFDDRDVAQADRTADGMARIGCRMHEFLVGRGVVEGLVDAP